MAVAVDPGGHGRATFLALPLIPWEDRERRGREKKEERETKSKERGRERERKRKEKVRERGEQGRARTYTGQGGSKIALHLLVVVPCGSSQTLPSLGSQASQMGLSLQAFSPLLPPLPCNGIEIKALQLIDLTLFYLQSHINSKLSFKFPKSQDYKC
jgi:hypothetical protein